MTPSIYRILATWLLLSSLGTLLVIFLPENLLGDQVILKLSDEHGPTLANCIGITLVLGAWAYYLGNLWARRHILQTKQATKWILLLVAACIAGCIIAATKNWNILLITASSVALLAQIALGLLVPAHTPKHR